MSTPTFVGLLAAVLNAVFGVLLAFGVDLTENQTSAILTAFNAIAAVVVYLLHLRDQKTKAAAG